MRWLLALISATRMRLSEAAGLHRDDIVLDAPAPHINLTAHPWRRLKTKSSARHIPLVGTALWAAQRLVQRDSSYAFHATVMGIHAMPTQPVLPLTNGLSQK